VSSFQLENLIIRRRNQRGTKKRGLEGAHWFQSDIKLTKENWIRGIFITGIQGAQVNQLYLLVPVCFFFPLSPQIFF
jgi:hypothetical protein